MRLTKRKALEICLELWTWLAETGEESKKKWPGWKKYGRMSEDCPCCEYGRQKRTRPKSACSKCPLDEYFGESFECLGGIYSEWMYAGTPKTRKEYAQIIADKSKLALSELGKVKR